MPKISQPHSTLRPSIELLVPSIRLVWSQITPLIWLVLIPVLMGALGSQLISNVMPGAQPANEAELRALGEAILQSNQGQVGILLSVLSFLWLFVTYPATIVLAARAVDGLSTDIGTCLRLGFKYFTRIYIVNIIAGLLVILGLLCFIIPGLIFLRRYYLAPYTVVRKDISYNKALSETAKLTKPFAGYIWGILGIALLLAMLATFMGTIPVVGFIFSTAISYLYLFAPSLRHREILDVSPAIADNKK